MLHHQDIRLVVPGALPVPRHPGKHLRRLERVECLVHANHLYLRKAVLVRENLDGIGGLFGPCVEAFCCREDGFDEQH